MKSQGVECLCLGKLGQDVAKFSIHKSIHQSPQASLAMTNTGSLIKTIPEKIVAMLQRHNMLATLVKREIMANALSSVTIHPDESKKLLSRYCKQLKIKSSESLVSHIKSKGITEADLSWQLELLLRIKIYSLATFGAKAEQRFLERKDSLDLVTYSLLRLDSQYLARELYLQIEEEENDFADLAAKHSSGPEKHKNGQIGPISLTKAHPILAEKLRTHEPGALIEPFKIQNWWLVVRLDDYKQASFNDQIKQKMCTELFEKWAEEETTSILSSHQAHSSTASPT